MTRATPWCIIVDNSNVYLALGEAAATGGGKATWNKEGYYLVENGMGRSCGAIDPPSIVEDEAKVLGLLP
ncbi:hypothetical protein N7454_011239 [Penicillium verhagenii]|nr:hypothetical protein N7454_011239 [Penicillium verhagenii]